MFEFTARIMNNREIQFVGGGGGSMTDARFESNIAEWKLFVFADGQNIFFFHFGILHIFYFFQASFIIIVIIFFSFSRRRRNFYSWIWHFFFFFISWFFPSSIRWDAICDGELRFRLMDRILREMYLKRGDRFFEILCDWIWKLGRG